MLKEVKFSLTPEKVLDLKEADSAKYDFLPNEGIVGSIQYDFGDTTEDLVDAFGDAPCKKLIEGHCRFSIQGLGRTMLSEGKSPEEIQERFYDLDAEEYKWKPSDSPQRKTALEKESEKILKSSDPEAEIAALEAMIAAVKKQI